MKNGVRNWKEGKIVNRESASKNRVKSFPKKILHINLGQNDSNF